MKKISRICSLCLCLSALAVLSGCGGSSQQSNDQAIMRQQVKMVREQQQKANEKKALNDYMMTDKQSDKQ